MNMRLKRCLVFVLSELLRIKFSCSWADADTLVYHAGATAIVHNITRNRQQHYTAHSDDITALALCLKPRMAATGQCGKIARIQVWGIDSCVTVSTLAPPALQRRITALSWSRSGSRLVAVGGDDNRTAFIFSFSRSSSAAQVYKENISGSASKDTTEDEYKQPSLNFSSPVLLFNISLQVSPYMYVLIRRNLTVFVAASRRVLCAVQYVQWK